MNSEQRAAVYAEVKRSYEQHLAFAAKDPALGGERRLAATRLAQMEELRKAAIAAGDPDPDYCLAAATIGAASGPLPNPLIDPRLAAIIDAAVASAMAPKSSAVEAEPALGTVSAAEVLRLEEDSAVASIGGVSLESVTAARHERERHAAEERARTEALTPSEAEQAEEDAVVARILAA